MKGAIKEFCEDCADQYDLTVEEAMDRLEVLEGWLEAVDRLALPVRRNRD